MFLGEIQHAYRLPLPAAPGAPISEFNHHFAGVLVIILGVSALLVYFRPRSLALLRYVWPISLLILGIYLALYSDPECWPTALRASFSNCLQQPGFLSHKIVALLLLLISTIELGRAARLIRCPIWKRAFPILAAVVAIYLLIQKWSASSQFTGTDKNQLSLYLILGIAIATAKFLYDLRITQSRFFAYLWPVLTIVLGAMLVTYRE